LYHDAALSNAECGEPERRLYYIIGYTAHLANEPFGALVAFVDEHQSTDFILLMAVSPIFGSR
jgi:hypothetical protein